MKPKRSIFHKISFQLTTITICAGLVPIILFGLLLSLSLTNFSSRIEREVRHGYEVQLQKSAAVLQPMVKSFIRQKAVDAALQIEFYLKANPEMTVEALQNDEAFKRIALQPVGKTGFTALLGSNDGIIYFHPSPRIQGSSIDAIAQISPELYAIMKNSLGGNHSYGPYPWLVADGTRLQKYNYIAPVGHPTADGIFFNLGAIISFQELYSPLESAEDISQGTKTKLIGSIEQQLLDFRNKGILLMTSGLLLVVLIAFFAGRLLSAAISRLRLATKEVKQGNLEVAVTEISSGELGELTADFNHMVRQLSETTVKKGLLQASEERLQLAIHGAELGVLDWDIKTGHVFFNHRWAEMLGYKLNEISHQINTWKDCFHPDEITETDQKLDAHFQGKNKLFEAEHRLRTKSGAWIWVLNKGKVIEHDTDGTPLRAVITQLDITSRKEKEQISLQVAKNHEQLKRIESLKTMAGSIAHRFNNAMMVVEGILSLLKHVLPKESEERGMATQALHAAKGASQVGSMMLTYVGQQPQHLKKAHLSEIITQSITEVQKYLSPSISLQCLSDPDPLYCNVDQEQIKEVMTGIITNAIESLVEASGTIEITFGTEHHTVDSFPIYFHDIEQQNSKQLSGSYVFCQVRDNGHGIAEKNLHRIFEPFFTTKFTGRGLGLSFAAGIIRAHHGAILVTSTTGKGTKIKVLLPAVTIQEVTH